VSVTTKDPELQTFTVIRRHGCEHGAGLFRCNRETCGPSAAISFEKQSRCCRDDRLRAQLCVIVSELVAKLSATSCLPP